MDAPRHSPAFRLRRFVNWFPLGLTYALLYMGRYNLTVAKNALGGLMSKADFGDIFAVGALVYGVSFLWNGPLTDRVGGRRVMLVSAAGAALANAAMGLILYGITRWGWQVPIRGSFMALYAINMYFQSFAAVAIVTVKAPWFHLRERGTFSTIFGVMISLGIYFAFDWGFAIVDATRARPPADLGVVARAVQAVLGVGGAGVDQNWWVFFVPALLLGAFWLILLLLLRDRPSQAGFADFDTAEESISREGERLPVREVFRRILTHPVLLVVCGIEFCSGVMRNGVMNWYPIFAKETGVAADFYLQKHWGAALAAAGIAGGVVTGWASDRFFQSRRAPMSGALYAVMLACAAAMWLAVAADPVYLGTAAAVIIMAVIGVHGILSGTATMDFAGSRNTGVAVGVVDGMVYLGTAAQSFAIGRLAPVGTHAPADAWGSWPLFLVPFALAGLLLSIRIWHALPRRRAPAVAAGAAAAAPAE